METIESLSERRAQLWRDGDPNGEVASITRKIEALYADRRQMRARDEYGDPAVIIKRARIESELERLMSD